MKNAAAIATLRELCGLGLAAEALIPALLEALHRVIPSACNLFDWVDAQGRIQRYYFEGPVDPAIARLYFEQFHNKLEAEAMPRFVDVVRGNATVLGAEQLNHRRFFDSALYNEIWRPQRLHYHLEGLVRDGDGRALGSLVLYRERGERIFSAADEATLARLLPYVARALQRGAQAGRESEFAHCREAVVNLDAQGSIVHLSRHAFKLLLLAHGELSPASAARPPASEDFPTLALLHRRLWHERDASRDARCTLRLANAWGQFAFDAERLAAVSAAMPELTAIRIAHHLPRELLEFHRLAASPLSPAQRKVSAMLLRGWPQTRIAAELGVSASTVIDHVRKIYRKLDLHSADELRARFGAGADPAQRRDTGAAGERGRSA